MTSNKVTHWSHPEHPLEWVSGGRYKCDGCKMDGIGSRYRCKKCKFNLHEECVSCIPMKTFQGLECRFFDRPLPGSKKCPRDCTKCDACGMPVHGFMYHYANTGLDFHPRCTNLQGEICSDNVVFKLEKQGASNCQICKETLLKHKGCSKNIPGWAYVSENGCNFHVYCVMNMAMQNSSNSISSSRASSSAGLSLASRRQEQHLQAKSKGKSGSGSSKWLKIVEIFLKTVLSILLGDPTTILASALAHIVTQGLFNAG